MSSKPVRIAKTVLDIKPYKVSNQKPLFIPSEKNPLKLDWNESTIPPSPKVMTAIADYINQNRFNWYPDVTARVLCEKLAGYCDVPVEYISCFGGSDMALEYIARTYLEHGVESLSSAPTYDNFRVYAQSTGAGTVNVYHDNPFDWNINNLIESASSKTRIIYVCNPNNPTGNVFTNDDLITLLKKVPDTMVVVDEAYYEFYGKSAAELVTEYNNVMVVRSFSKALGLASLRIGYIISDPVNLDYIHRIKVGKNLNAIAQVAAVAAIDDFEYTRNYIDQINTSKEILALSLPMMGYRCQITPGNYFLVKVTDPDKIVEELESRYIFVRNRTYVKQLSGYIRITIGTPDQTKIVINALRELAPNFATELDTTESVNRLKTSTPEIVGS